MNREPDRFQGCLLGLACGDAVGAPIKFHSRGHFEPLTDMIGGGKFRLKAGEWTGDTSMALCLAESLLLSQGFDPVDQMHSYWRWFDEGRWSCRPYAFGIDKTVQAAALRFRETGEPYAGSTDSETSSSGSLTRLGPIPMFFHRDRKRALQFAELSSWTTHASEDCIASCRYFADVLIRALHGQRDKAVLLEVNGLVLPAAMQGIVDGRYKNASEADHDGSSHVVATLEAALWAFWTTDSFADAVLRAANLGGDASTTAAVCGQLAGAYYGASGIPAHWMKALTKAVDIRAMAIDLHRQSPEQFRSP